MNNKIRNFFSNTSLMWIIGLITLGLAVALFIFSKILSNSTNNSSAIQTVNNSNIPIVTSAFLPTITPTQVESSPTVLAQSPYTLTATPDPYCQPSQHALLAYQENTVVIVKNISTKPISVRVSWDRNDPFGVGDGLDSYFEPVLLPSQSFSQEIKNHITAEMWAWDTDKCVDQASLILSP